MRGRNSERLMDVTAWLRRSCENFLKRVRAFRHHQDGKSPEVEHFGCCRNATSLCCPDIAREEGVVAGSITTVEVDDPHEITTHVGAVHADSDERDHAAPVPGAMAPLQDREGFLSDHFARFGSLTQRQVL